MIRTNARSERRRGATLVETAFVLVPLIMLLCGIFVYGQLLMDWNLLINASQEGCRFALANNVDPSINTEVQTIVNNYLVGKSTSLTGITVTVTGVHQGAVTPVNNLSPGDQITVTVTGNYQFPNIIPLVTMPSTMSMTTSATLICEGGT